MNHMLNFFSYSVENLPFGQTFDVHRFETRFFHAAHYISLKCIQKVVKKIRDDILIII